MFNPYQLSQSARNVTLRHCPHELAPTLVNWHQQQSGSSNERNKHVARACYGSEQIVQMQK
jgi:hypothetical protein